MAFGPLLPYPPVPVTVNRTFKNVHIGAGANSKHEEGMGVEASVAADSTWRLRFEMPPALPSGTPKLRLVALASASGGVANANPKWASVAMEEDPSSATLNAEGTQTITWGAGDTDVYKELKVTLDADTPVAGEIIVMDLVFETVAWSLSVVSTWRASIIWE